MYKRRDSTPGRAMSTELSTEAGAPSAPVEVGTAVLARALRAIWLPVGLSAFVMAVVLYVYVSWLGGRLVEVGAAKEAALLASSIQPAVENAQRDGQRADIRELLERTEFVSPDSEVLIFTLAGELTERSGRNAPTRDLNVEGLVEELTQLNLNGLRVGGDPLLSELRGDLYVHVLPLRRDDVAVTGYMALLLPIEGQLRTYRRLQRAAFGGLVLVMLIAGFVGVVVGRAQVLDPLRRLSRNIVRLQRGEQVDVISDGRALDLVQQQLAQVQRDLALRREDLLRGEYAKRRRAGDLLERGKTSALDFFAASLAHEIGSPMQVLLSRTEQLQRSENLSPSERRALQDVEAQLGRIHRSVENVRRLASGREIDTEVFEVHAATDDVVSLMEDDAAAQGLRLRVSAHTSPLYVEANRDAFQQVLYNLLLNAFEWTPSGGAVTVALSTGTLQRLGGHVYPSVRIEVRDDGAGMDEQTQARAFELFFTRRELSGGTGVGLALVQMLIARFRGDVRLESALERGTRVWVDLPRVAPGQSEDLSND